MKHNFGAGPCILPQGVLKQASQAVINFNETGLSILEISHRSPEFQDVINETIHLIKDLMGVPNGYSIILLPGGASLQFAMAPMNLLAEDQTATYLDSGVWARKAIKEAELFGNIKIVASSKDQNYNFIPKKYNIPAEAAYFHCTSNNTIYGTEMHQFPKTSVPIVCDMSSNILSRKINVADFGLIYAGAQKNIGPAGVTVVIIKNNLLGKVSRKLPSMLNYQAHIEAGSMYNTPPVYAIYVSMLNLRWLQLKGGIDEIEKENIAKAETLYREIDRNSLFEGTCAVEDRSRMNVCFIMKDLILEKEFLKFTEDLEIVGIKGHRSVGGFRASLYNALPITSVHMLVEAMQDFEQKQNEK